MAAFCLAAVTLVWTSPPALACSCALSTPAVDLRAADAVIIGTAIESIPSEHDPNLAAITFSIDEVLKGSATGDQVVALAEFYPDGGSDSCARGQWGPGRELIGKRLIVLFGEHDGRLYAWEGCGSPQAVSNRADVLAVAPPATSAEPARFLVAGAHAGADLAALDGNGNVVGYVSGDSLVAGIDECGSGHLQSSRDDGAWQLLWRSHDGMTELGRTTIELDSTRGRALSSICTGDRAAVVRSELWEPHATQVTIVSDAAVERSTIVSASPDLVAINSETMAWVQRRVVSVTPIADPDAVQEFALPASFEPPKWITFDGNRRVVTVSITGSGRNRQFQVSILRISDDRTWVSSTFAVPIEAHTRGTPRYDHPFRSWSAHLQEDSSLLLVNWAGDGGWLTIDLEDGSYERTRNEGFVYRVLPTQIWLGDEDPESGDLRLVARDVVTGAEVPFDFSGDAVTAIEQVSPSRLVGLARVPDSPLPRPGLDLARFAPAPVPATPEANGSDEPEADAPTPEERAIEQPSGSEVAGPTQPTRSTGVIVGTGVAVLIATTGWLAWRRHRRQTSNRHHTDRRSGDPTV